MNHSPELTNGIEHLLLILSRVGISDVGRRILANGIQVVFSDGSGRCRFNFYFSLKKGFSAVPAGGDNALLEKIQHLSGRQEQAPSDRSWTGSDEAGKGDYMGPLTAAAVYVNHESAARFSEMGITDSKLLSNNAVRKLANRIREIHQDLYSIVSISPRRYNARFQELKDNGANSLDLLAQCHAQAINDLLTKTDKPERILIDRFGPEKRIAGLLSKGDYVLELRERAESDPAVAAASILARDAYLSGLDEISRKYGIQAVSGSGQQTDSVCREYVRKFGGDVLDSIVKLHFRNTDRILDLFTNT